MIQQKERERATDQQKQLQCSPSYIMLHYIYIYIYYVKIYTCMYVSTETRSNVRRRPPPLLSALPLTSLPLFSLPSSAAPSLPLRPTNRCGPSPKFVVLVLSFVFLLCPIHHAQKCQPLAFSPGLTASPRAVSCAWQSVFFPYVLLPFPVSLRYFLPLSQCHFLPSLVLLTRLLSFAIRP